MHRLASAWLAALLLSGCYTMKAQIPGTLRGDVPDSDYTVVGTFEYKLNHTYYLWGLVNKPGQDLLKEEILAQCKQAGANGVANLQYDVIQEAGDAVISCITCGGIVGPMTYRVTGDLVRINRGAPAGKREKVASTLGVRLAAPQAMAY